MPSYCGMSYCGTSFLLNDFHFSKNTILYIVANHIQSFFNPPLGEAAWTDRYFSLSLELVVVVGSAAMVCGGITSYMFSGTIEIN